MSDLTSIQAFRRDGFCSPGHFQVLDAAVRALEVEIARLTTDRDEWKRICLEPPGVGNEAVRYKIENAHLLKHNLRLNLGLEKSETDLAAARVALRAAKIEDGGGR